MNLTNSGDDSELLPDFSAIGDPKGYGDCYCHDQGDREEILLDEDRV